MEKTNLEIFREYVSICGYTPVRVWESENGYFAMFKKPLPESRSDFTQISSSRKMARLGHNDLDNELIIKGRVKFNKD